MGASWTSQVVLLGKEFFKTENLTHLKRLAPGTAVLIRAVAEGQHQVDSARQNDAPQSLICLLSRPREGLTLSAKYMMLIGLLP